VALAPGTRLGVYDITAQIGEGGMGQVYRATDTRLKRQVAIKILPPSLAADHDRLARFQREAEVLASLNHPHIAGIYGLEESDGVFALVMELVEGEDLSQRIGRGAIPLDEALPIAKQIAEALEAAHEQGIIHRDLKPANIKVRSDGTVKVLDFGLAKAMDVGSGGAGGSGGLSMSPTLTSPAMMTGLGMILGTAAYMAPEQAKGRVVDRRADIWAFGVVLHEMITGTRLFDAEDMSETLAAVLTRDVSMTTLPAASPARLRALLRDCLVRDPRQRLRDIGDARIVLERIIAGAPDVTTATPGTAVAVSAGQPWLPWVVTAAALAAAAVTLWAPWRAEKPADRPLVRLDVDLGADVSLPIPSSAGNSFAISPDGTRLVYASGTPTKLFTRRLDQPKATELQGAQNATVPFFSPDGLWVGFLSGATANKISVDGGSAVPLGDWANVNGAIWGEDGSFFISSEGTIVRIPNGGRPSETVAERRGGELQMHTPDLLPGGDAVLFAADNPGAVDKTTIDVVTLIDRQRKTVVRGGASPRYLATAKEAGHLVYVNGATLFAIAFDPKALTTRGTALPVVDDVAHEFLVGTGQFDVSRTGTLVYRRATAGASTLMTMHWVDAAARREPLLEKPSSLTDLSLSPDGTRVALTVTEGSSQDVWVFDPRRDAMTRLTFGGATFRFPRWSPDGRHVVFASAGNGIFQARADGSSQPQALTQSKNLQYPSSFAPDGRRLAFEEITGRSQIWTVPLEDVGGQLKAATPEPFLKSSFSDSLAAFSPDGRWLAYQSNESGTSEVYVRAFPPPSSGPAGKWQISNNGGTLARWSRTGHELVYRSGDQIMAVSYSVNGDTFVGERPRVWIAKLGGTFWDLAPDGKRVAVATRVESATGPRQEHEVVFLLNFFDELRRRVPLGK